MSSVACTVIASPLIECVITHECGGPRMKVGSTFRTTHTRCFRQAILTVFDTLDSPVPATAGNTSISRKRSRQESRTMSPYLNVATPEPLVVVKNRPRRRGQLTPKPRIRLGHDGLSTGGAKGTRTPDLTRQNADLPAVSLRLGPIHSRSLPAGMFSGLDGVKSSHPGGVGSLSRHSSASPGVSGGDTGRGIQTHRMRSTVTSAYAASLGAPGDTPKRLNRLPQPELRL